MNVSSQVVVTYYWKVCGKHDFKVTTVPEQPPLVTGFMSGLTTSANR